ncbi:GPP34 family phosphoprotein [Streptomyces sp. NPDC017260]|uniref:GOLPH3/VPS74 family protein n=1 Tax=unclassified Streptomyces TaxID=2593676 RepID=UPI0037AC0C00
MTLPEEFVLLAHSPSGKVRGSAQASFGCAAAELGELALRRKVLLRPRVSRTFGIETYGCPRGIDLLGTGRTGLAWADALLAELEVCTSEPEPVTLRQWLRRRGGAAPAPHREALTERGHLLHKPSRLPGRDRYHPCTATRAALVDEIRGGCSGRRGLDAHLLLLCDLAEAAGTGRSLSLRLTWRQWLDWSRRTGVLESVPEDLRDTSELFRFMVPSPEDQGL